MAYRGTAITVVSRKKPPSEKLARAAINAITLPGRIKPIAANRRILIGALIPWSLIGVPLALVLTTLALVSKVTEGAVNIVTTKKKQASDKKKQKRD